MKYAGHGDDRLVDRVTQVGFGRFLELAQNLRRDFRRGQFLIADLHLHVVFGTADDLVRDHLLFASDFAVPPAHEPLDRVNGLRGVGDRLPPGGFADEHFALVGERDHARREPVAFGVGNDLRFFTFHHGDHGVRRAEVDTDNFFACHESSPSIT